MAHYNLIFQGEIIAGASLDEVKNNVAKLFKADAAKTAALFSGKAIVIKRNLDKETTKKYLAVLKKAGAVVKAVQVEDESSKALPESAPGNTPTESSDSTRNSSTGLSSGLASLVNYNNPSPAQEKENDDHAPSNEPTEAHKQDSTPQTVTDAGGDLQLAPAGALNLKQSMEDIDLPDINHLSMSDAQSGSLEEFAKPVEAVPLPNIDNLSMSEANSGSLEEFARPVEAVELPDISELNLSDPNDAPLSSGSPKPEPVNIPDISSLSMAAAREGSLEGIEAKPDPVEIPDTSHLDIEKPEEKPSSDGKATFQID